MQHYPFSARGPWGIWNDDELALHCGFPVHGHHDVEIVTYVRDGVLEHEDSSGGREEICAGNVRRLPRAVEFGTPQRAPENLSGLALTPFVRLACGFPEDHRIFSPRMCAGAR